MALGGIILYLQFQNSVEDGGDVVSASDAFSFEFRVRFPGANNTDLIPTERSGALVTLSNGGLGSSYLSLWYEKESASSATGNIYLTSSAGRVELVSASLFDDKFYSISVVKEHVTGTVTLSAYRYDDDRLIYSTSSFALSGAVGFPFNSDYSNLELGSSTPMPSSGQFWGHEFRLWHDPLTANELRAHSAHFESYGRDASHKNDRLKVHWRMNDGISADPTGKLYLQNSAPLAWLGTGSNFTASTNPFTKFLEAYAYIPGLDYGWNQQKVRAFSGSMIDPREAYYDERFVSLEFNLYDALNEDLSHVMTSYDEMNNFIGLPINKYREDYEGLQQMRETYFKRLQGPLNFRVFVDMLDFFDTSFVSIVERLLPARALFKGDELVVESHMLERPKYQYQLRPIVEGRFEISGSIAVVDYGEDLD